MAETDMKTISELDYYVKKFNEYTIFPVVVNDDSHNVTRKVFFDAIKTQIIGYELTGTLAAGSTDITLSSTGTTYAASRAYVIGDRVTVTDTQVTKNYICINPIANSTNWETDAGNFVEYSLLNTDSTVDIYTDTFSVNPTAVSIANNAITLTFPSQSNAVNVKVRVW